MSKQTVAIVVGHELAHQWFGNIVTMVSSNIIYMQIEIEFNNSK